VAQLAVVSRFVPLNEGKFHLESGLARSRRRGVEASRRVLLHERNKGQQRGRHLETRLGISIMPDPEVSGLDPEGHGQ
jgi:hypothetical protein